MAYQNFHPRCRHIITQYIEALHTPEEVANMREFSNRSYDVGGKGWTKAQTAAANKSLESYRAGQARAQKLYADKKQWQRYQAVLGDDAPKTFSGFRRMKAANGEKWNYTSLDYKRRTRLANHPETALPNADKATAANEKFTKYLFNPENKDGWAKGRAFESRLGYNIDNWKELKQDILDRAAKYPAIQNGQTKQGNSKYVQDIVMYGKKNKPANVKVVWVNEKSIERMITAFIEEVK